MGSKISSPTSTNKPVARKSLLERLKESAHFADHVSEPPPLNLTPEMDVTVIDGSKIEPGDDDNDIDDDSKQERTAKIHSESIDQTDQTYGELDLAKLTQYDLQQRLPGEINKDKDDDPSRQDSTASFKEL